MFLAATFVREGGLLSSNQSPHTFRATKAGIFSKAIQRGYFGEIKQYRPW
jgi:hypothetical protein